MARVYSPHVPYVRRYPRPRLVRVSGRPLWRSFYVAYSYSVNYFAGPFPTITAYAVWSPRGVRRVLAF